MTKLIGLLTEPTAAPLTTGRAISKIRGRAVLHQARLLLAATKVDPQRSSGRSRYLGAALRFTEAAYPRRNEVAESAQQVMGVRGRAAAMNMLEVIGSRDKGCVERGCKLLA